MMNLKKGFLAACCVLAIGFLHAQNTKPGLYHEPFRPQVHFSPLEKWMNDPNGMVYNKGVYHLFYQFYPDATVWGPMHWGHAESKDLIHWQQKPIALYPDSLGYIFSGSAVLDVHNTSGFGKNGQAPLIAIFTHHDPKGEKAGKADFQNESIAYSLDDGKTWTKYSGNPVLKNPGIKDFRDPKVMWFEASKKWIMTLATKDRVTFFSSLNLKDWKKESEFGAQLGAHGGVWECPDLFPLSLNGKIYWVLLVSINPGGPNQGSATQYFVGNFNGNSFIPKNTATKWIDYGPDNYAGVTWSNTGKRKIFLGWMSNWLYATQVPTVKWRSAMTVPRELSLQEVNGDILLASKPAKEFDALRLSPKVVKNAQVDGSLNLTNKFGQLPKQFELKLSIKEAKDFSINLSNTVGEQLIIGFDKARNSYYIDRRKAGESSFNKDFAAIHYAPKLSASKSIDLTLVVDAASVELFADNGLSVMTGIFFPKKPITNLQLQANGSLFTDLEMIPLKSIWK